MVGGVLKRLSVLMALVLLAGLVPRQQAAAQTIANTAMASWQAGGQTVTTLSNTVAFGVVNPSAITIYNSAPGATTAIPITPSQCGGAAIAGIGAFAGGAAATPVTASRTVQIGGVVYFTVAEPHANLNPAAIDSMTVVLTTSTGDKETITIYETGANTGVFAGAMPTSPVPPSPVPGDCKLSVEAGTIISIAAYLPSAGAPMATAQLTVLVDPYGFVFDSGTGAPVDGASVTLIDVASGQPAHVVGPDGVTSWPATQVTGSVITDASGTQHQLQTGQYRFPAVAPGQYRLSIVPPAPYTAPSKVTPQQLTGISRPDGSPLIVGAGSYGDIFLVSSGDLGLRIDVPLDRPEAPLAITKNVSSATAQPGDAVFYTIQVGNSDTGQAKRAVVVVDHPARQLRIRPGSVRINGKPAPGAISFAADGSVMTVRLGTLGPTSPSGAVPSGQPSATATITYAATVNMNAAAGQAVNTATATDSVGTSASANAALRIIADTLTDRMTIIGRVSAGGCLAAGPHHGIAGIRVMLEDGSYAITDKDGRYHFDGVVPGDHVAAVSPQTLPSGGHFVDCARTTRSAGSAISRFVSGQGGSLAVADFYADLPAEAAKPTAAKNDDDTAQILSDKAAAGGETDWLAQGDGPNDFLFPAAGHNPRSPAIRVVIRHRPGQTVALAINGVPVNKVAFDGIKVAPSHTYAVSIWTGVPLDGEKTILTAIIHNADGSIDRTLTREIHFTSHAAQAQLVAQQTHLIADGTTRPVIALRITDRDGFPVHAGVSGDVTLNAPYESAEAIEGMQARALVGIGEQHPRWVVKGDDGIAYVTLAPTMVSGAVHLDLTFKDGEQKRSQTIDGWMVPGNVPWTLVGLAEGSAGAKTIADAMERNGQFDSDLGTHARTAFYAKGRVLGKFLLTVAYDSAKQTADQTLDGAINPTAYYTVFADGSARRFDAASRDKLYVRIESRGFYALFGDFQTGFAQTQLAYYTRDLTGVTGEAQVGRLHLQGFAARTATSHRHLEIQGGGVTGPYSLGSAALIANSETVSLVVRDRFRSQDIVSTTPLTRFIDYDIDLLSGTITFKAPILSHDDSLNPQFIVVDFDVDPTIAAANALVGGGRIDATLLKGRVRLGATAISDHDDNTRTNLGAVDLKAKIDSKTELRAEAGESRKAGQTSLAWNIEAERHDKHLDLLAYAHSADPNYGVGETSAAELGWRKIGADAKLRISDHLAIITSLWTDQSLTDGTVREALLAKAEYRLGQATYHLGVSAIDDQLPSATSAAAPATNPSGTSTLFDAGVSRKFLHDRLELDADASFALGAADSIDAPPADTITVRYALTNTVKLIGSYEIAHAVGLTTHTARLGFEMAPWKGAKMSSSIGDQAIDEYGPRTFAAFGLAQSLPLGKHLALDASIDANKVLSGFNPAQIVNPAQPVVTGGQLDTTTSGATTLTENFTALSLGAAWKARLWTLTARGEYRDGQFARREGLTLGAIRQLGEGSVVGSGLTITHANGSDGSLSAVIDGAIAFAHRPEWSDFAILGKFEFRSDRAIAATDPAAGASPSASTVTGPAGTADDTALALTGNAKSTRLIASYSANWSPKSVGPGGIFTQRSEIGGFFGMRYNFDRYDGFNLAGLTVLGGVDLHIGIGSRLDIGGSVTVRENLADHTGSYAIGPSIGLTPATNVVLNVGYNVVGFQDPDFAANRSVRRGVFATLKVKFDNSSLAFLGLDGRAR